MSLVLILLLAISHAKALTLSGAFEFQIKLATTKRMKIGEGGVTKRALQNESIVKIPKDVNNQTLSSVKDGDKYTWPREERSLT